MSWFFVESPAFSEKMSCFYNNPSGNPNYEEYKTLLKFRCIIIVVFHYFISSILLHYSTNIVTKNLEKLDENFVEQESVVHVKT